MPLAITFEAPRWLWLWGVCVPLVWVVTARWPLRPGAIRWRTALVRTVLVLGLVAAAAGPVRFTEQESVSAVAVVDVSASIPDAELDRARRLTAELQAATRPPHTLRVVTFAAAPAEVLPAGVRRPRGEERLATDIARALGFAAGLADPARTRRLLLVSDGHSTQGDPLAQAARLASLGVRIDYVRLDQHHSGAGVAADVAVESITAPAPVAPHATFPLRVQLATDRPARVRLTLNRDGRPLAVGTGGARDVPMVMEIAAGTTEVTWQARIEDATTPALFSAEVHLEEGRDPHPENNRALLAVATQAPPRVLILAATGVDATSLAAVLRAQTMSVDIRLGSRAIGQALTPADLTGADLVVLCNLPSRAIPDDRVAALETYVRDGGGLLVTGGPGTFGPGGWDGSRLETLLPLRLDTPQQRDEPTLALALVIDRSGSMSGAKMDLTRQAARGTAGMLPADDQLAVIAFDSQATTVVPLQRAANRLRIAADIGRIQPTGGTNILAGLREAVDQLTMARAKKKHAILLSDGQSATEGIAELVDAAVGAHITISTVGVGDGTDDALLQLIARQGGGRYYHTRDPASIPRIFTRETAEVASSGIIERPTSAIPRKRAAVLEGIPWATSPRLRGYVRTHARAQAELLLATEQGDPLLARWPVGLGQVTAWTSDLGPRWADTWTRWPAFAQVWGQVARATMRPRAARQFPLAARVEAGMVEVTVDAVAANDSVLPGLQAELQLTEIGPLGKLGAHPPSRRLALTESAPGQYDGRFPVSADGDRPVGALLLRTRLSEQGRPVGEALGQVSVPLIPELRPQHATPGGGGSGPDLLPSIAAATGGGELRAPPDLFAGAPKRRHFSPLRPPLLGALALLFVADVVLRRLSGGVRGRRPALPPAQPPARP